MSAAEALRAELLAGARALGLELRSDQAEQLLGYLTLLGKWNQVYNLTAVRTPAEMLTHHLLDSLAVVAPLRRQTGGQAVSLLDVGSGGGLPGVVIAIVCPEIAVDAVDAVGKKTAFIQQVAGALGLRQLRGLHARVESLDGRYNVVTSRAFATLADFVAASRRVLADSGVWMAMKGKRPEYEIAALPPSAQVFHVEPLTVPGLDAERCLVWLRPRPPGQHGAGKPDAAAAGALPA